MEYTKLTECLMKFSQNSLIGFLGEDLVEQYQTEWESEERLTKRRLAEMIIQLNGAELLKKKEFRREVVRHMEPEEIEEIFETLPSAKKHNIDELSQKAEAVADTSWKPSVTNWKLLDVLGVEQDILEAPFEDSTVMVTHQAGPRFYELLDYQFVIKQRILADLNSSYMLKRMLVHMPTGTGKTKTMMHTLIHYYNFSLKKKGAIIWLAHTTELLQQAYDTFSSAWQHLGDGEIRVYKIWGNRVVACPNEGFNGILFCGIQKLQAIRQNQEELFKQVVKDARLIIFDEAHKALANETRNLVEDFMKKPEDYADRSLVGLTATPGRTTLSSDENKLLSDMFEDRLISIDIDVVNRVNMSGSTYLNSATETNVIRYFQKQSILAEIKKEQLEYSEQFSKEELKGIRSQLYTNGYVDFSKSSLEIIGRNRSRNKAILDKLTELSIEQIPTIVFACSVAHAKLLSMMLSLKDIPNRLVLGEMSSSSRIEAIDSFKDRANPMNILINYEVLTTGFDATNIRCVFITRPTQSVVLYSQMLGRGLRGPKMGGNKECLLVDLKDNLGKYDAEMAFNHFDAYWS